MAYVDLNPIRAGITDRLEGCQFTSILYRLKGINGGSLPQPETQEVSPAAPDGEGGSVSSETAELPTPGKVPERKVTRRGFSVP